MKTGSMAIMLTAAEFSAASTAEQLSEAGVWNCGRRAEPIVSDRWSGGKRLQ